ncbi:MAG: cobalt ECF transporter T component CbiQ [Euryarchaeota archaeon]|nr:cobalt ECF transporter T component CbiQ [Euryarchaeota archaeon]
MNIGQVDRHAGRSPLRTLDPRCKILAIAAFVVMVALLRDWHVLAFALIYVVALLSVSGVPARHLAGQFALALPFALLGALSVFLAAGPLPAFAMFLRIGSCVLALLMLSGTTPFFDLLKGLQRLRMPRLFVNLLLFTYRYLFVIAGEMRRMSVARRARGGRRGRSLLDRAAMRTVSFSAGMVLVRAHERGQRMHDALRSRGFDGEIRTITRFRAGAAEALFSVAVVSFAVLLLAAEWGVLPRA